MSTSKKEQETNIMLGVLVFTIIVAIVGVLGYFFLGQDKEVIQGEVDSDNYRVSSKVAGRVVELRVKEGDYVHVGDTLAILEAPEISAQERVTQATSDAAKAVSDMTHNGTREEMIQSAYQTYQQAAAAATISEKTYMRMQHLFEEGVISQQKRDEAKASYDAAKALVASTREQWKMAQKGARDEEKRAASEQARAARSTVDVVKSLLKETVQISPVEGEVSDVYPLEGELVGMGSPIMSIDILKNMWGFFNVREDQLKGMKVGDVFTAYSPAFQKNIRMKVYYIKDQGSYAAWKATKNTGRYDLKTLEVKAKPLDKIDGLRPGMSLIVK